MKNILDRFKNAMNRFSQSAKYRRQWNLFYRLVEPITRCSIIARNPTLSLLYAKHLKPPSTGTVLPTPETELLIETVGGSASAAFVEYFNAHNPQTKVAYIGHVPASVKYCVKRNIPTIVLTRNILDYVRSASTRLPQMSKGNAIRTYYIFHKEILPLRDKIVVADFYVVRENPQQVIRQCNAFYGTNFALGDNDMPRTRATQYPGL